MFIFNEFEKTIIGKIAVKIINKLYQQTYYYGHVKKYI